MYKVSIIIPVYNQEKLIIKALDSIPRRDDIEVLVIDDCSTDNTFLVLKNYQSDLNLTVYHLTKNMGVGYARNVGFMNCTGEYIFGLDSDDELITDMWSRVVDEYLDPYYDLIRISRRENDGHVARYGCAFHTFFFKRELLNLVTCRNLRRAEDYFFLEDLNKAKKVTEFHTRIIAYKYNYPRQGSLEWERLHGK